MGRERTWASGPQADISAVAPKRTFSTTAKGGVNRPGFVGGSNFQIGWSRYEQDDEQILP